ncbi:MAG: hypothetical protein IIA90_04080, partial [Chloroflexi bacterium]|nr:hypothetical protein [Chloroflexota bacterium]
AWSGGGGARPAAPASQTSTSVAAEADSAPEGLQPDDYWFRGVITDILDARAVSDAPYVVEVEVTEYLDGSTVQVGATFNIVQSYGFGVYRCFGQVSNNLRIGAEVLVYAHTDGEDVGDLATCADERYFVLLTPVEAAATPAPPTCRPDQPDCQIVVAPAPSPTCPPNQPNCPLSSPSEVTTEAPTPPPYPTCSPDIHCAFLLRTVTIDLWSCDGGPCDGEEEPGCQRSVSLQVGEESFAPDPFFCIVQFHAVPFGDYLVVVARRVACGSACDAPERCQVVASANRIAIEPAADGECPVHVIR